MITDAQESQKMENQTSPSYSLLRNIAANIEHPTSQETRSSCKKMKRKKNPMVENSSMRQAKDSPDVGGVLGDAIALQERAPNLSGQLTLS